MTMAAKVLSGLGLVVAAGAMLPPRAASRTVADSGTGAAREVDANTYQDLVTYASYPWLAQSSSCSNPSNGAEVIKQIENSATDTQIWIWRNDDAKEIIVSVPGSNGFRDTLTDANIILVPYKSANVNCPDGCSVHSGFLAAWNSVSSQVIGELESILPTVPDYATVISGHSLGGGVAALAFASLINGPYRVKSAFTYGQPRTGNKVFANYIDSLSGATDSSPGIYYRVTHADDNVPKVPPTQLGYKHSRTEFWESSSGRSTAYRCYGQEPSDCNNSVGEQSWIVNLYDIVFSGPSGAHAGYDGFNATCS